VLSTPIRTLGIRNSNTRNIHTEEDLGKLTQTGEFNLEVT
jgi:hypothetical protein